MWSTPVSQSVSQLVSLYVTLSRWLGHRGAFASPSTPSDGRVNFHNLTDLLNLLEVVHAGGPEVLLEDPLHSSPPPSTSPLLILHLLLSSSFSFSSSPVSCLSSPLLKVWVPVTEFLLLFPSCCFRVTPSSRHGPTSWPGRLPWQTPASSLDAD